MRYEMIKHDYTEIGRTKAILELVQKGHITVEVGANELSCTVSKLEKLMKEKDMQ